MPYTLAYYGGKHPSRKLNKWINNIIGYDTDVCYIEPFAGMLGVLMNRPKAKIEIVNDTNGFIVQFWKALRDHQAEMQHKIMCTPISRQLFAEACTKMGEGTTDNVVADAVVLYTVVSQSIHHGIDAKLDYEFGVKYKSTHDVYKIKPAQLLDMCRRIERVQIENNDANRLLEKTVDNHKTIVYCDPPYLTADVRHYGKFEFDAEKFSELVRQHKGRIYISGYNDEWDHLGFARHEFNTMFSDMYTSQSTRRTEVLWANVESSQKSLFD